MSKHIYKVESITFLDIAKNLVIALVLAVLYVGVMSVINAPKVKAYCTGAYSPGCVGPIPLNPDPPPAAIPANMENYLRNCQSHGNFSPSLVQWIAPQGSPSAVSITVPYGTTSIPLNFIFAGAVCFSTNEVQSFQLRITNTDVPAGYSISPNMRGVTPAPISFSPPTSIGRYDRSNPGDAAFNLN